MMQYQSCSVEIIYFDNEDVIETSRASAGNVVEDFGDGEDL